MLLSKYEIFERAALLEYMHFNGRPEECKYCEDYTQGFCEGGLFKDIQTCMIHKAMSNEMIISNL